MRKYFLSIVALVCMLFATSCQESLVEPQMEGSTTFTVQVPNQMGTKAIGEASSVTQLLVDVYPFGVTEPIYQTLGTPTSEGFEVELNLIQDQKYDILFWAQTEDGYVDVTETDGKYSFDSLRDVPMNSNYLNNDNGAAFFHAEKGFVPNGTSTTITLVRPFAQLNLGTTDKSLELSTGDVELLRSLITIKGVATNFNVYDGIGYGSKDVVYVYGPEVQGQAEKQPVDVPKDPATLTIGEVPTTQTFNYVSMNYLAVLGDTKAVVDVDAKIIVKDIAINGERTIEHSFKSVPVQENYRTNIVGNLISSTTDFNVVVDADFAKDENGNLYPDNDILVVENAAAAQAALDNAKPGDVIELVAGVNYGTLKFRANPGNSNTTLDDIADAWQYNYNRSIEDITIIGAESAKVDGFVFETGALPGDCNNRVTIKNLVIDGVEFTDAFTASSAGYNAPIMITTSNATIDGLTVKNCKLIGDNSKLNLVYLYGADGSKNVSLINNTVDGIARFCELRGTENVTITGNTINNTYEHAMLLAAGGYSGNVSITGNTADGIHDRFVRMAGGENATIVIKDNKITNYLGNDPDYIKVTDSSNNIINDASNVTIENNKLITSNTVTVPANNTKVVLDGGNIEVTVPASDTSEGDEYRIEVSNENTTTNTAGETSVSFDLTLYKNGTAVNGGTTIYEVALNIGAGKIIANVTHNGTALTKADTGADQTYKYDSATGVLTIFTNSFSPFEIIYSNPIAKVGNAEYGSIDDAIAAWTNNTTLTLLADVTLSDVIMVSSTEYHVLDLSTFTMTAASKKDAIQVVNNGRSSASYALDIKADATNPGGITANGKAIVRTTGKSGVKDRPIIRFYNGVFNASNIISHSGSNGTNCPQFQFHGGVYTGTIYANRALIQFYGGTFNGSLQISVDSSAYALISGGRFKQLSNLYGSSLNSSKFTIGSAKGVFDRGVYVDDEGYYVVGGSVITEFGDKFAARAFIKPGVNDYLYYSSAKDNGLYYTNAEMAKEKNKNVPVELK